MGFFIIVFVWGWELFFFLNRFNNGKDTILHKIECRHPGLPEHCWKPRHPRFCSCSVKLSESHTQYLMFKFVRFKVVTFKSSFWPVGLGHPALHAHRRSPPSQPHTIHKFPRHRLSGAPTGRRQQLQNRPSWAELGRTRDTEDSRPAPRQGSWPPLQGGISPLSRGQ